MRRDRTFAALLALAAPSIGLTIGRLHLIGPNPGTFFALGALAAGSVVGIGYGIREGRRVARAGERIGRHR